MQILSCILTSVITYYQISLGTKTLIAYKAVVWFFCTVLHGLWVKVLLSPEVFITYVTLVGFILHMNSFLFGA